MFSKSFIAAILGLVALIASSSYASNVDVDVDVLPTPQNSNSIHNIIQEQKRYVVFNSRRLDGSCLPICVEPTPDPTAAPTPDPTAAPTDAPTPGPTPNPTPGPTPNPTPGPTPNPTPDPTAAPTPDPTAAPTPDPTAAPTPDPTAAPTPDPTAAPTPDPTAAPTPDPTAAPTPDPTAAPTEAPITPRSITPPPTDAPVPAPVPAPTDCVCDVDDPTAYTFKCGTTVYLCPGYANDNTCSSQISDGDTVVELESAAECEYMQSLVITDDESALKCPDGNALSNRVCYTPENPWGVKTASEICGEPCQGDYVEPEPGDTEAPDEEPATAPTGTKKTTQSTEPDPEPAPVADPVPDPVPAPEPAPVADPVPAPVSAPTDCVCDVNDTTAYTFKCGTTVYLCPGYANDNTCSSQISDGDTVVELESAAECEYMQSLVITDDESALKCPDGNALSNRVCYTPENPWGVKTASEICGEPCPGAPEPELELEPDAESATAPTGKKGRRLEETNKARRWFF